ncbi:MAG: class I SAM-dependent rRNA methyltransferase, partial [Vicinamibacteria bacterium]
MGTTLTAPRRYQLTKEAVAILRSGHPWIFRRQMSSAASVFANGQWLRLMDGENQVVGYGFYHDVGAIAVRVLRQGKEGLGAAWVEAAVRSAIDRRGALRRETDGFRVIHGENDGLPAVTADVYGSMGVISSYARGADPVARLCARILRRELSLSGVLWKPGSRRHDETAGHRPLYGEVPERVSFREGPQSITVAPRWGQKSGTFLDLRGLRRYVRSAELGGRRVLDLFSYTGTLGAAAEIAGATRIWHVDSSRAALDLGEEHHPLDPGKHRFLEADVFEWLRELSPEERFDLVISDPPSMTSRAAQVPKVLRAYDRLYREISKHVSPRGIVAACCCTSRVDRESFLATVRGALGREFRLVERIPPEIDHPIGFKEADYLKILLFRRKLGEIAS